MASGNDPTDLTMVLRELDMLSANFTRRMDEQDKTLARVEAKVDKTNGRVTILERARERGQGMVAAFRWVPWLLGSAVSAGMTILIMAVTGSIR